MHAGPPRRTLYTSASPLPRTRPAVTPIAFGIGFSWCAAALLALLLFTAYLDLPLPRASRGGALVMLAGLCVTQWLHLLAVEGRGDAWGGQGYATVQIVQSAGFYWLGLGVLRPAGWRWHPLEWAYPALGAIGVLAAPAEFAPAVAMLGGVTISVHLLWLLYRVRDRRRWFRVELRVLAVFALIAVCLLALGLSSPALGWRAYATAHALAIALAFWWVLYLLLRFPDLATRAEQAVATAYAVSTLGKVDVDRALAALRDQFEREHAYREEGLTLARMAERLGLSPHQLSELVNTRLGIGFSQLLRQHRVAAAKRMLIEEPQASVLSVGLSVGFASQSGFYSAFREETGTVPSRFRAAAARGGRNGTPRTAH